MPIVSYQDDIRGFAKGADNESAACLRGIPQYRLQCSFGHGIRWLIGACCFQMDCRCLEWVGGYVAVDNQTNGAARFALDNGGCIQPFHRIWHLSVIRRHNIGGKKRPCRLIRNRVAAGCLGSRLHDPHSRAG